VKGCPASPIDTVIILDISASDYSFSELNSHWASKLAGVICAACGTKGRYGAHGNYFKYHYQEKVQIFRVRCRHCRQTHAVIPSFSLSGTSIGTSEAEQYLFRRQQGASRNKAGKQLFERGMSSSYPKQLERMLHTAVSRAKALLPAVDGTFLSGLPWIEALCGPTDRPLFSLNRFCLAYGFNAVCCCRSSILVFARTRRIGGVSHNPDSAPRAGTVIDSW
jgi:hypothetical protein